ncbi:MAG: Fic family protein [Clostridia bacterium]|nr:Fic family protein [Clostridia bacterium]
MKYSLDPSSANCYEGTTCLINKLNIRDEKRLSAIEAQITFAKAVMLEENPIEGNFDFEHFKKIHRFLFSDLYSWAGEIRTVNISKKRTRFTDYRDIEVVGTACFQKIADGYMEGLSFDEFVYRIAELYNDINHCHPFREGNGRVERIYFTQLIRHCGYDINLSDVDTDELMMATIHASMGVMDFLIEFFRNAITKPIE